MANPFLRLLGAKKSPAPVATPPPLPDTDPVKRLVTALIDARKGGARMLLYSDYGKTEEGRALLALPPEDQARAVADLARRALAADRDLAALGDSAPKEPHLRAAHTERWAAASDLCAILTNAIGLLLRSSLPLTGDALRDLAAWAVRPSHLGLGFVPVAQLTRAMERAWPVHGQDEELRRHVGTFLQRLRPESERASQYRKHVECLESLLGVSRRIPIVPGEVWADAALARIGQMTGDEAVLARDVLQLAFEATSSAPTGKWLKRAQELVGDAAGRTFLRDIALAWFPLAEQPVTVPRPHPYGGVLHPLTLCDANQDVLKGLAWMCGLQADAELARAVARLCLSALKKIPGIGPRAPRLANACIWALGRMPQSAGLGQLALLKIRIRFGTSLKAVDKALAAVAAEAGVTPEELEEMAVPAYGMETVGVREETFGDFTARLEITGTTSTLITWRKADGKVQKSVPAVVKEQFAEDWKELKTAAADIEKMLPAQRDRIDNLYLQQRSWAFPVWRERYLDHPLTGTLARRLIWTIVEGERRTDAIWHDGALRDRRGHAVPEPGETARVELWHPIGHATEEVLAWRGWLEEILVQQPFKQAHREVYLLTEAELTTGVYSNRFAAHVIKQHQFNALCGVRGWKNKLRLMVDDTYPPATRLLPAWKLRAEFWIEGIGDDFGSDTNDAGVYLRLATDQVRFYRQEAPQRTAHAGGGGYQTGFRGGDDEPLPLREIPALVLSEILRDVDLFVGVCSVGNDPTWADGGPDGRHRDYWQDYSFGSLNETAKTRRDVLQRLLPRLKIAGVCELGERFLVVRGKLRTYKIHLGSGNILMLPNDQYLCIVPKSADEDQPDRVALPFEGDRTLSIILSKAFLLAADDHIKDETITRQIGRPAPG